MKNFIFLLAAFSFVLSSCVKEKPDKVAPQNEALNRLKSSAVKSYSQMALASYNDAVNKAKQLKSVIDDFVANPSESKLTDCKKAWLAARIPYGQTEAYRFYGGPIDGENGPEGFINAWPMDESFVDYVANAPTAGIINQPKIFPIINDSLLVAQNEFGSEVNVATGYHAIEFLLWGQDLYSNSAGKRPYTDYVKGEKDNADRRSIYLKVCAQLLVDHLALVRDAWKENTNWYQQFNQAGNIDQSLKMIFDGIGKLSKGELAGERMLVALESGDQEDEHSCFSDNTHIDIKMNFEGISNVYFNRYKDAEDKSFAGTSLSELVSQKNKAADDNIRAAFDRCRAAIDDIPVPFDQAIINDKDKINKAVKELQKLSDYIADGGTALGLQINTSLE